ncbi:MAG: ATP-binding cassette domain-containing protein, partial [Thermofilaceae archaeon]
MIPVLSIEDVRKSFRQGGNVVQVLDGISLEVGEEFIAILGPSGCGKTTLLRIIAGVEKPDGGRIVIHDKTPRVGFIFQFPTLLPWLTVLDNVALPLRANGMSWREAREKAH